LASPDDQLESFIAKFEPALADNARACLAALRLRLPTAFQLVYDNYNALAIGFCASDRASDCVVSLAVTPRGPALSFYYGASLPDQDKVLSGAGSQNRYVRLTSASVLVEPAVEALIQAALAQAKTPMPTAGPSPLIIKAVSAKQRPRR
jgi:hypothetical protein